MSVCLCVDGTYSEDGLSSGGEFFEDNVEFRRPAPDVVIKSVPIVPSQQVHCFSLSLSVSLCVFLSLSLSLCLFLHSTSDMHYCVPL